MEIQPETNMTNCYFCNKEILVAKTATPPPIHCAEVSALVGAYLKK